MNPITNEEIEYTEKLLLPDGESFNEERRKILRDWSSLNVQACPGSGKTTILLAKLLILAKRMPIDDNRGICVLTHTNVAIDKIKDGLAKNTGVLFQYPNFFGTFQSFVDKFLAIPACIHYLKSRPDRVDGELYNRKSQNLYYHLNWNKNPQAIRNWLFGVANRNTENNILFDEKDRKTMELFKKLKIDYVREKIYPELNGDRAILDYNSKDPKSKDRYETIADLKHSIITEDNVIGYDEAYMIALKYLKDYKDILKTAFKERFSFVFVDEMQDTDIHQNKIIDTLFDSSDVVVQKIGDKNQAIYGKVKADNLWNPNSLPMNDSKRFHNFIADKVKFICIEENNQLIGNNSTDFIIQPTIIAFNEPKQVLPKFGELIVRNGLHKQEVRRGKPNIYKAIGWRKEHEKGGLSISSYWDKYAIEIKSQKEEFENLNEYLVFNETLAKKGFKFFKDRIFTILIKALIITDNKTDKKGLKKSYSKTLLISKLKEFEIFDDLQIKICDWILKSIKGQDISCSLADYVKKLISSYFTLSNESLLDGFLKSQYSCSVKQNDIIEQKPINVFEYHYSANEFIEIKVGTIHSAKGETHTATLYLETIYYEQYESDRLIDFIKGIYNKDLAKKLRHIESLKMAYVGITRPSHFLCLAIHNSRIIKHEAELEKSGWKIERI